MCSCIILIKPKPRYIFNTPKCSDSSLIGFYNSQNNSISTNDIINENLGFVISKKEIKACSFDLTNEDEDPQLWPANTPNSKTSINFLNNDDLMFQNTRKQIRKSISQNDRPLFRCENPIINDEIFEIGTTSKE